MIRPFLRIPADRGTAGRHAGFVMAFCMSEQYYGVRVLSTGTVEYCMYGIIALWAVMVVCFVF